MWALISSIFVAVEYVAAQCMISAKRCNNYPEFTNTYFPDAYGHAYLGSQDSQGKCARRAEDFHHWCGNGQKDPHAATASTHLATMTTAIYHPTACDPGWSLYKDHCFIHVWEMKTQWDAEAWCQTQGGNLASIHGPAENEFVFTLTKGLSSWIGYQDMGLKETWQWTDNTPATYENKANDCAGREHEKDCQPEQVAQKWYDWSGVDRGTWVCKKRAKWKLRLLRDIESIEKMQQRNWEEFKKPFPDEKLPSEAQSVEAEVRNEEAKTLSAPGEGNTIEKKECGEGVKCEL